MLKTTVLVIVVAIAAVLIYAATQPDTFRLERQHQRRRTAGQGMSGTPPKA